MSSSYTHNLDQLNNIKKTIESMNKNYHIEILKLLVNNDISISKNNNGSFVNLSNLDSTLINKLEEFIKYVEEQQSELSCIEDEKISIKKEFFTKNLNKSNKNKNNNINNILDSNISAL
jgi:hypothetical protein